VESAAHPGRLLGWVGGGRGCRDTAGSRRQRQWWLDPDCRRLHRSGGLKAGRGLIPFGPKDNEPLNGLGTHGVISRSVRDTAAMLNLLAGPDDMAAFAPAVPAGSFLDDIEPPPSQLRVGYTTYSAIRKSPHAQVTPAVENAARLLIDLGHEEVDPPHDDYQLARDFLTISFVAQAAEIARIKTETGVSDKSFELNTRLMAALGRRIDGMELQVAQERRRDHIAGLARLHAGYDLLMIPSIGEPPIKVGSLDLPRPVQAPQKVCSGPARCGCSSGPDSASN
jgi:amidase